MSTFSHSSGATGYQRRRSLWRGTGSAWSSLTKFFWAAVRLILAGWLWGTAVRLAHFQPPVKSAGLALALVSLALVIWGLWGLWRGILTLGLKRLVVTVLFIYGMIVVVNVLTVPDTRPVGPRILMQLGVTGRQTWGAVSGLARTAVQAPDEFLFAHTGRRSPPKLPPGFPTPDPNATPIRAFAVPVE